MDYIKNRYNAVMNFLSSKLDWLVGHISENLTPVIAAVMYRSAPSATMKEWTAALFAVIGVVELGLVLGAAVVLLISSLTWIFALVLPIMSANCIAILLTVLFYYDLFTRIQNHDHVAI